MWTGMAYCCMYAELALIRSKYRLGFSVRFEAQLMLIQKRTGHRQGRTGTILANLSIIYICMVAGPLQNMLASIWTYSHMLELATNNGYGTILLRMLMICID